MLDTFSSGNAWQSRTSFSTKRNIPCSGLQNAKCSTSFSLREYCPLDFACSTVMHPIDIKWHLATLLPHASAYSTTLRSKQAVEPANQLTINHAASVWQNSWNHQKQSRIMGGELSEHCGIGGTRGVLSLYTAYEGAHSAGGCAAMF